MPGSFLLCGGRFLAGNALQRQKLNQLMTSVIKIAEINTRGEALIFDEKFFPYDLYLEEERDFDTLINNMNNFYHWCASRVLSLDRKYAKACQPDRQKDLLRDEHSGLSGGKY